MTFLGERIGGLINGGKGRIRDNKGEGREGDKAGNRENHDYTRVDEFMKKG